MAKLRPITGTISIALGGTALPIRAATFEIPLRTSIDIKRGETAATLEVKVDRTAFREQLTETFRAIADQIEATFSGEPEGATLLTCPDCGAQVVSAGPATLRHEGDGAHALDPAGA